MTGPGGRKQVSVVWELSEEGKVVVDVDSPLRPFGELPVPKTPPHGTALLPSDETEPDGEPSADDPDTI